MDKAEEVKIDNFKAQLRSILPRIKDANLELEYVLKEKEEASKQLADFILKKEEREKEHIAFEKISRAILHGIEDKKQYLKRWEKEISKKESNLEKRTELERKKLEKLQRESERKVISVNSEIDNLLIKQENLENNIVSKTFEFTELRNTISKAKKEEDKLSKNLKNLFSECELSKISFNKLVEKHKIELNLLQVKTNEERDRIKSPMMVLMDKQKELARWEKNLEILTNRHKRIFKSYFPNTEIKIK